MARMKEAAKKRSPALRAAPPLPEEEEGEEDDDKDDKLDGWEDHEFTTFSSRLCGSSVGSQRASRQATLASMRSGVSTTPAAAAMRTAKRPALGWHASCAR